MKRLGGSCKLLIILTFLSFLGVSAANAASYNPKLKYRTINTEHFAIHYPAYIEDVAQRAALVAEQVYDTLEPKFEWKPWGRTQMLLTDSSDDPNGMASVLPYNWIYIRVTAPRTDSSLSDFDHWLRLLIMHEYTHILQMDQVRGVWKVPRIFLGKLISPNGMTPGWIKEGLATYEETKYKFYWSEK